MDENKIPENVENTQPEEVQEMPAVEKSEQENSEVVVEINGVGEKEKQEKKSVGKEIFEWVQAIVVAFVVAMFIRSFVFTMVVVDGPSMEPTFEHGQRLVVTRYDKSYKSGDVIVFRPENSPETPYIKRVIATEGQTVSFDFENGFVMIDGEIIDEPYIKDVIRNGYFFSFNPYTKPEIVVEEETLFVMGDNRNNSKDSRDSEVGLVREDAVIGKAVFRWWPLDKIGTNFSGK